MLELKNIYSGYYKKNILSDISFSFEKGKLTSIVGPNGCGKSTLLKTASGILKPFSGDIALCGKSFVDLKRNEIAQQISYLPQVKNFSHMTVKQLVLHGRFPHLKYPRHYSKRDEELAFVAMKKMGVDSYADCPVASLSGGNQQLVYVAMAFCQNSDFILLDEPTTYLDISNSIKLMNILCELAKKGKGVVAVIHDLIFALKYSDEIVVINNGKILKVDSPEKIYDSGILNEVFSIEIKKHETDFDCSYYY